MKRAINGPAMLHPATPAALVHSRRIRVLLLDKKEMFVKVENKNTRVLQIFQEVCDSLNLKETDLFGLALLRDNECFFVHMDTKLQKLAPKMWGQKEGVDEPSLTFLFRVMNYVHEVRLLKYRTTRHLYYLQLKENFLTYNLSISEEKCFLLSAYALITDHGPYKAELHNNSEYFKPQDYLPSWVIMRRGLDYMSANLPNMHRDMSSEALSRDARLIFITELSSLPCSHNFHMYRVTRKKYDETDNFSLAVGPLGLHVYESCDGFLGPAASFLWPGFPKFNCDRKKFEVTCGVSNEVRLSCFARSKEWCLHLRNLCKATQKFQQTINPRLAELKHQEDRDAGWWPEKYVPSDSQDNDREAGKGRENGVRHRIAGNGQAFDHADDLQHVVVATSISVSSTDTIPSIDERIGPNGANLNGDAPPEILEHSNGLPSSSFDERKSNICLSLKSLEAVDVSLEMKNEVSETMNHIDSSEAMQRVTSLKEEKDHKTSVPISLASNLTASDKMVPVLKKSLEELNFDDLNLMDNEILIDTPPNSDSRNLTTVTPLSSNLSPLDPCLALSSNTPKNTATSVYRHASYLGTPLSPYLYDSRQQPQQRQQQQQLHQALLHRHPVTRHPTGSSGRQSLLWRASCSGRLMKRHLRSLECAPVHSTEHITNLVPLQNYVGHCMYKSTPLSVYNMPVYHQNSINNIFSYSQENNTGSGMLNQSLQKNSIDENVGDVESEDGLEEVEEVEEVSCRPPPPAYEDVARNSKMRLTAGSRGLEFESDEFIGCDGFRSDRPGSSNASGSYSDFNWVTSSSSPKLPNQPRPPSILDFQFPLLDSVEVEEDYRASDEVQRPQQHRRPFEFQQSDSLPDRRFPFHRSSLNSYEQWMQHHHHLQAFQVQPQKIKAVSPLFAEQVQLSTPLLNRKNFQVFEPMPCNASPQDLKVPGTKTLRKASSTESEPGEMATKERGRGKPVQRHHSNITYLRDYKNSEDSKLSFPLVSALLKDPSLQQNVRSFPSNLAALVCDGESQQT